MPKKKNKIPYTVSDTIPYVQAYENGIFEIRPGVFSMSYIIPETNFKKTANHKQKEIAEKWSAFLNTFDSTAEIEVTLRNRKIAMNKFKKTIFLDMETDGLNEYREEYNKMLADKLVSARNNIETIKILTVSIEAEDFITATERFAQINRTVQDAMNDMTKAETEPMSLIERLDILKQIMVGDDATPVYQKKIIDGHISESFTLENCKRQGITTKDVIGPAAFEFKRDQSMVGERFVKTYSVYSYPTYIKGTILTDFAQIPSSMLTSVYYKPYDQNEAFKMLEEKRKNNVAQPNKIQKEAVRRRGFGDVAEISTDKNALEQEQVDELLDKMNRDDMKLYSVTFLFSLFADTLDELKRYDGQLKCIANENQLEIRTLIFQQEAGFGTALPLGNNQLYNKRMMTSDSIAAIIPFDVKEVQQDGGKYYGINAVSGNMILYNRAEDVNPDACILGMPGTGKSFLGKQEMIGVLLGTNDSVYVLDPEREYKVIADAFGGTTIELSQKSATHINPFDLNLGNVDDKQDAIKAKSDFIEGLIDIMIGSRIGLSAVEKSIISRSVSHIYEPYVQKMKRLKKTYDPESAPTILDFYNDLLQQPQIEANNLALSLERFVNGSQDAFSHKTNVNINDRFIVYDTKDIGAGLKEAGQYIALDNIFNKIIENFSKGIRTWLYVDGFHDLMRTETSAVYIAKIWIRARKWNGIPCAITQNVEDMLKSNSARTVINNSNLVILLGQSQMNKKQLSQMFDMSSDEEEYISGITPGTGIMNVQTINANIPMMNDFPKDTQLYSIMSTKPDERIV